MDFIVDDLSVVEESLHGAYDEREGKFHFNPDKYADLKAAGLKANSATLKKEKDKLKSEYEAFKKKFADWSDDDAQAFADWKERRALTGGENEGDPRKATEELAAKYQQQLKAERARWDQAKDAETKTLQGERDEWKTKWKTERLSNRLKEYAVKSGVFPEELETFVDLVLLKGLFDLSEDEDVIFMQDGMPSAISAEKAINETLRERFKRFYEAPTQGGSGSQAGRASFRQSVDWHKLPATERMAYGRKTSART